ncbi:MAG: hypothetical protein ACTSU2_10185 [Promethearchaeota archaeon]
MRRKNAFSGLNLHKLENKNEINESEFSAKKEINKEELEKNIIGVRSDENIFISSIRKVINLMNVQEDNPYYEVLTRNIHVMASEISMNLDEFLDQLNISFRTEEFLLFLFQELYEQFVLNAQQQSGGF